MKLGIMQPYFFPYIGYFDLINRVDKWIVFDVVRYTPRTWMNRNRILHPSSGWQYISAPIDSSTKGGNVDSIKLVDLVEIKTRIIGQIEHYRKHAPYYSHVVDVIEESFGQISSASLVDLNVSCLDAVCRYIGLRFNYDVCSELELEFPEITHPGQWALEISSLLGASEYINPIGGKEIFRPYEFDERGISLKFIAASEFMYSTKPYVYEAGLSILDVMMWNDACEIKNNLDVVKDKWDCL